MALVQVKKSDLSGQEIEKGQGARVRVIFDDPERTDLRADLTVEEVAEVLPFAVEVETRPDRRKSGVRRI